MIRALLEKASAVTPDEYDAARRVTKRARQALADLMTETDVILTPSAPGAAPHGLGATGSPVFNRLWTLMGTPCVNVPGVTDASGLPLGMQIVGRPFEDALVLHAGHHYEKATQWAAKRPPLAGG
jgi:Asp-tRNA(Asn)/Glu-tRNA(Gln) amidotransferase A subunit family amidase